MKYLVTIALLVAGCAFSVFAQEEDAAKAEVIIVCPITGAIDPGVAVVVKRAVEEARELNAKALIFKIDTPGGRVDSAVEIASAIMTAPCRTVAYITGELMGMGAISAGALISFACDDIIMSGGSNIGAATPVIPSAQGMQPTGEKEVSFMRAKMRALAESNGHNVDIGQAMVDKDIELRSYLDEFDELIVYAVTPTGGSESEESPGARTKSPIEEILKTLTGETPGLEKRPVEIEDSVETSKAKPGTVVFEDGSELVLASGKLLTLTPIEAEKYGLIPAVVESMDDAVRHYMLGGGTYHEITPNWAEKTFKFLTNPTIAGLLLMLGMGGLYFEVKTPGFGIPGIIGVTSLFLLFGGHYVLGLTETIDLVLILAGIILILAEVFVIPGFGIAGIAGLVCLMVGTYLALMNVAIPQYSWDYERLNEVVYSLVVAAVTSAVMVIVTWRILPKTPLYGWLVLTGTQETSAGYVAQTEEDVEAALGQRGMTTSMLRPAGWARFGDKKYQVVSRGAYIKKGVPVEVVEVEGNRYVVEEREEKA